MKYEEIDLQISRTQMAPIYSKRNRRPLKQKDRDSRLLRALRFQFQPTFKMNESPAQNIMQPALRCEVCNELLDCPFCGNTPVVEYVGLREPRVICRTDRCIISRHEFLFSGWQTRQAESWIPVSQKLPKLNQQVICYHGKRTDPHIDIREWRYADCFVTHWRELPPAPIEKCSPANVGKRDHQWEWDLVIGRCKCGAVYPGEKGEG